MAVDLPVRLPWATTLKTGARFDTTAVAPQRSRTLPLRTAKIPSLSASIAQVLLAVPYGCDDRNRGIATVAFHWGIEGEFHTSNLIKYRATPIGNCK